MSWDDWSGVGRAQTQADVQAAQRLEMRRQRGLHVVTPDEPATDAPGADADGAQLPVSTQAVAAPPDPTAAPMVAMQQERAEYIEHAHALRLYVRAIRASMRRNR